MARPERPKSQARPASSPRNPLALRVVRDPVEEDSGVSELVTRLEAEADRELADGTVTLRWGRRQIAVVKRAASLMGIPYQTYLKQVVFRQALTDIERAGPIVSPR